MKLTGTLLTAALVGLMAAPMTAAQQPGRTAQPGQPGQAANAQGQAQDQLFAEWLAATNFIEVKLAELAKEKAETDKVKELAQQIRDDHKKFCDRLAQAVPGAKLDIAEKQDRPAAERDRALVRRGPSAEAISPEFAREVSQEFLSRMKDELKDLDGKKFDQAYLGYQVLHHHSLLAWLDVAKDKVSPQLREVIEKEREAAQDHLDKSKKLMEELADRDNDNS